MDIPKVTLGNVNAGAPAELFEEEFAKVVANIADPNTNPEAVRTVTIQIKIKPTKDRRHASTEVACHSKLAPIQPHQGMMMFAFDGNRVNAYSADIHQPDLGFEESQDTKQIKPFVR